MTFTKIDHGRFSADEYLKLYETTKVFQPASGKKWTEDQVYGNRLDAHFKSRGLILIGQGRAMIASASRGWTRGAMFDRSMAIATADGLRCALAMVEAERMEAGSTSSVALGDIAWQLPLAINHIDIEELSSGAWRSRLNKTLGIEDMDLREAETKEKEPAKDDTAAKLREELKSTLESEVRALERGDFSAFWDEGDARHKGAAWAQWIQAQGLDWLEAKIADTIAAFEALEEAGLVKPRDCIAQNVAWLSEQAKASADSTALAARVIAQFEGTNFAYAGFNWLLGAHGRNQEDNAAVMSNLGRAWGFDPQLIEECFSRASPWCKIGVFKPVSKHESVAYPAGFYSRQWSRENADDFKSRALGPAAVQCARDHSTKAELLAYFYDAFAESSPLTVDDWTHVSAEVADIVKALKNKPVKILLWGDPGAGKSSLAMALAKAAGMTAISPSEVSKLDAKNGGNDQGMLRLWSVEAAQKLAAAVGAPLLVVDECEPILSEEKRKMDIAKFLETPGSAQIWIANSLSGAHEAFIRRFDFVLKLPAMPLDSRLALAHRLFGPGDLAERLARSMKSPAELSAASSWCEAAGEASWAVVSRRVAGHQAALNAAKAKGDESSQEAFTVTPAGYGGMNLSDFAGNPRLSAEIERIAGFFSEPARFAKLGAKIPKGYLLSGPPGSGKTWFVRVLASVAGVPMIIANGAMLAKSPEKFAEMFSEARKRAPCLVFVDEFDVCAGHAKIAGKMDLERQKVLNRLLGELDGFDPLEGVLFLGATHNGSEIDPAVRRSGRMSGHLAFGHPDKSARAEVWRLCLAGTPCEALDFEKLSESTRGFSNAEIVEAANRAKLGAAMDGKDSIGMREILAASDAVYWGDPGDPHASEEERWRTCVHESGHALVALRVGHIAERMTARPRDGYSGAAQIHRDEGLDSLDSGGAKHQISILLGGYAAEKGVFGRPANGASSDLSRARSLCAKSMLDWALDGSPKGYLEGMGGPALSQSALSAFESSSTERLAECLGVAETILSDEREALLRLSTMLMERKELTRDEILEAVDRHED